jgi:hypothetical protein
LQRPVGVEADAGLGQPLVDHPVGVRVDRGGHFAPVGNIHQQRTPRLGAEIHADRVFGHVILLILQQETRFLLETGFLLTHL